MREPPDHLNFGRPAVASIEDPDGGVREGMDQEKEGLARVKELGFTEFSVIQYDLPVAEVIKHYSAQAGGKGRVRSKDEATTVSFRVEEGTLLIGIGEKDGKTVVTRVVVGTEGSSVGNALPTWMRDALREQKS